MPNTPFGSRAIWLLAAIGLSLPVVGFAQAGPVSIDVDATRQGPLLKHVWQYYGYDECNYTVCPDARDLMKAAAAINAERVYLRMHFLLNNREGPPSIKWGFSDIYREDENGEPVYSFDIMDEIMDAVVAAGCLPLVEIGFMPKDLSARPEPYRNSEVYALDGGCFYPPKDYGKWAELIRVWVMHCRQRYPDVEISWLWELWNEPNISYFHGSVADYNKLFDYTEQAVHEVLPDGVLGGPHTAGVGGRFLRDFLRHCARGTNAVSGKKGTRLDYVGFHAKGGVRLVSGHVQMNLGNQLRQHREGFSLVAEFPEFRATPIIIGEADPDGCAGCPSSEFPERAYRNVPAYGAYVAAMMKYSLDLARREQVNLKGVVTWAWMFDRMPWFQGYRTLATNGIHKPVFNAFKMLGQMRGQELPLSSSGALDLDDIVQHGVRGRPDINGMAVSDGRSIRVLIWNYHDDLLTVEPAPIQLTVQLPESFAPAARLTHYRIDDTHSNAFTEWCKLGKPQNPDPQMIQRLRAAMELETLGPAETIPVENRRVRTAFDLPRFGLSLIVLEPAGDERNL